MERRHSIEGAMTGSEVSLVIYELHGTSALNMMTRAANLGGAYHVGVQVYWLEWSFGWCEDGTGVYMVHPTTSGLGTFTQRVSLGHTPCKPKEVLNILNELRRTWAGQDYHVLRKNCAHFSVELVKRLRVAEAPAWVNSLASVGDRIVSALGEEGAEVAADQATPAEGNRAPPPMANFDDDDELEDLAYSGNDLAMREMAWRRAKGYVLENAVAHENASRHQDITVDFRWGGSSSASSSAQVKTELLHYQSFRRAVARATSLGMGRRPTVAEVFTEDSDEEHEDPVPGQEYVQEEKMDMLWMKPWPGDQVRARLRLQCNSQGTGWPPTMPEPQDFAARFEGEMRRVGGSWRASSDWPSGAVQLVRKLECTTSPGAPAYGDRIECAGGKARPVTFAGLPVDAVGEPPAPPLAQSLGRLQRLAEGAFARQAASRQALAALS